MKKTIILISAVVLIGILIMAAIFTPSYQIQKVQEDRVIKQNNTQLLEVSLPQAEQNFQRMKENGWNIQKPLVWGYYFYDHDKKKLRDFRLQLSRDLIVYEPRESSDDKEDLYLLYAYEEVSHTPSSFLKRYEQLADLAVANNIEVFDGWDAGKEPL